MSRVWLDGWHSSICTILLTCNSGIQHLLEATLIHTIKYWWSVWSRYTGVSNDDITAKVLIVDHCALKQMHLVIPISYITSDKFCSVKVISRSDSSKYESWSDLPGHFTRELYTRLFLDITKSDKSTSQWQQQLAQLFQAATNTGPSITITRRSIPCFSKGLDIGTSKARST